MKKVLILDSSKVTAAFIQKTLHQADFSCHMAYNYDEARKLLAENNYFVGLSSIELEGAEAGKGIDLLLENKIPAIAVTSSLDEKVLSDLSKKNIVDYVLKKNEHAEYIVRIVKRVYKNRGLKVMVVDDSSSVRRWISNILKRQGLEVLTAADGKEASKLFYKNPDLKLVLTDYTMPEMNGIQLTAHLRTIRPMDELSIIVLSSDSNSRTAPLFLKTGANDFIHKSASIEEILCRVNSNLEVLELLEESRERANKDFLTGMWNRRYFFEYAEPLYESSIRHSQELCLAIMDIDHFKRVNDTYGHDAGDAVLKKFTNMLRDYVGEKGLAARFGGEEFTVILDSVPAEGLENFMNEFRELIEKSSTKFRDDIIEFTISIGATCIKGNALTGMISKADDMLYEAKTTGRNKVLCEKI